ncbi:MAG: LysM peptidoglycan-binding domain-containing protein [Planctomycetaceae bacterium]
MHRDKKLGLALALMVIGFGTAFCFKQDLSKLSETSFFQGAFSDSASSPITPDPRQEMRRSSHGRSNDLADSSPNHRMGIPDPMLNSQNLDDPFNQGQNFTHQVSQSSRSPEWNDLPQAPPTESQPHRSRDQLAQSTRNYHVPEHNYDWDTPDRNSGRSNRDASEPMAQQHRDQNSFRNPFNNEATFTSYPDLLNESGNSRDPRANSQGRSDQNYADQNNSPRARLNNSIVSVEEEFDPFGAAVETTPSVATPRRNSYQEPNRMNSNRSSQVPSQEVSQNSRYPRLEDQPIAPLDAQTLLIHEVRKAETLSGISARYLGSANKFMQIYEANRDILKSPHDIRVGMKLRIPRPGSGTQAATSPPRQMGARLNPQRVSQSWNQQQVESLPEPYDPYQQQQPPQNYHNQDVFVPVRRSPFGN